MSTVSLTPYKSADEKQATRKAEAEAALESLRSLEAEVVSADEFPVVVSGRAASMAWAALDETDGEDGDFLRVGVKGGGCAGFQYSLNFTDEVDDDDVVTVVTVPEGDDAAGAPIKVVTDTFSASYLKGTELDYVESLQGAGFKFVNPNARRTCGCGSSFAA